MTFRPAREISIEVRRRAVRDPANYELPAPSPTLSAEPGRWPLRLLIAAFTGLAGGLSLLAFHLPRPWGWPAAAIACAGVWAFWRVTDLGIRVGGPRYRGRHRRPRRRPQVSDIDRLKAMLDADTTMSAPQQAERRRPDQTTASRP